MTIQLYPCHIQNILLMCEESKEWINCERRKGSGGERGTGRGSFYEEILFDPEQSQRRGRSMKCSSYQNSDLVNVSTFIGLVKCFQL